MTRPAHRAAFGASAIFVAGLVYGVASCSSSTTTSLYTPFTGLRIPAESIFKGYACGMGPGQIYAYAAFVCDKGDGGPDCGPQPSDLLPYASNVYACDVNGEFQNIPGSGSYQVEIYAYDKASFSNDFLCMPGACPAPTMVGTFAWKARCTGNQEPGNHALVVCGPLMATAGANDAGPDASAPPDGALEASAPEASTSGDASEADVADAEDAGAPDADGSSADAPDDAANRDVGD